MVKIQRRSINTGFTTSNLDLPSHFFLGHPSRGFKGIHFLEAGLAAGSRMARQRFEQLLDTELRKVFKSNLKGLGFSPVNPHAGINLQVLQNVTNLSKINIRKIISEAFSGQTLTTAKEVADSHYNQRKGSERLTTSPHPNPTIGNRILSGKPLTKGSRYRNITNSFRYNTFNSINYSGIKVQTLGNRYTNSKLKALNFGLRTG